MSREILYVADPMCSWCWGFAPVITAIREQCDGRVPVSLVVGGLRPGTSETMDDRAKDTIRHHWEQVSQKTGQPFDFTFFERNGFVYDTEPACRAAVTVRSLRHDRTLDYLEALHHAFYADNRDVTGTETLSDLATRFDIGRSDFEKSFGSDEMRERTANDFHIARSLGVEGFPAILVREGDRHGFLSIGYRPFESLQPILEAWLDK